MRSISTQLGSGPKGLLLLTARFPAALSDLAVSFLFKWFKMMTHEQYKEEFQYCPWCCTHKKDLSVDENGKKKKIDWANNGFGSNTAFNQSSLKSKHDWQFRTKFALGVKDFTFMEMVEAARHGHSFKRYNNPDGTKATRFLWIDIDNELGENITTEELDQFVSPSFQYTSGASGTEYKYHVFVFLDNDIRTKEEFIIATQMVKNMIEQGIGRSISVDPAMFTFDHILYGCPQKHLDYAVHHILPDTKYFAAQFTKEAGYQVIKFQPYVPLSETKQEYKQEGKLIPYNTAMLLNEVNKRQSINYATANSDELANLLSLEGKRFDLKVPKLYGGQPIPDGRRYVTAQKYLMNLVPMYFRCLNYGLDYCYKDLEFTFKRLISTNFESGSSWLKDKWSVFGASLKDLYDKCNSLSYREIEDMFDASTQKDLYRRKGYNMAVSICYCNDHAIDGKVIFQSKDDFEKNGPKVSYEAFRENIPDGIELVIQNRNERSDKGKKRPSKHDWIKNFAVNNTLYYANGNSCKAEARYCENNKLHYVKGKVPACQSLMRFCFNAIEDGKCRLNFPDELNLSKQEKCDIYFDLLLEQECRVQDECQSPP